MLLNLTVVNITLTATIFALVLIGLFRFVNVTLWQCRKFGNCPWWLEWLSDD